MKLRTRSTSLKPPPAPTPAPHPHPKTLPSAQLPKRCAHHHLINQLLSDGVGVRADQAQPREAVGSKTGADGSRAEERPPTWQPGPFTPSASTLCANILFSGLGRVLMVGRGGVGQEDGVGEELVGGQVEHGVAEPTFASGTRQGRYPRTSVPPPPPLVSLKIKVLMRCLWWWRCRGRGAAG